MDSSEDRSKALLEKLRQQARNRQLEFQDKKKGVHEGIKSSNEEEDDNTKTKDHKEEPEIKRKVKKRKKSLPDTTGEVKKSTSDAKLKEEQVTEEVKVKKLRKKKIPKETQESVTPEEPKEDAKVEERSSANASASGPNSLLLGGFEAKRIQKVRVRCTDYRLCIFCLEKSQILDRHTGTSEYFICVCIVVVSKMPCPLAA